MLKIRLQRVGRVHQPVFRLVLTDSKNSTKSGKSLEILGNYDARIAEKSSFKSDRVAYWMSKGAQVSPTVHNLLITKKLLEGKKINNLPLKKPIKKEAPVEPEAKVEEKVGEKAEETSAEKAEKIAEASSEVAEETIPETVA